MRKRIGSHRLSPDGYYDGKGRNLNVLFGCFRPDRAGEEHLAASHASALADNRSLPPRVVARLSPVLESPRIRERPSSPGDAAIKRLSERTPSKSGGSCGESDGAAMNRH